MSPRQRPSARGLLAALGAGGVLAATAVGGLTATAEEAEDINGAYGVAAKGTDPHDPTPLVTSSGKVKTASGSASGKAGTFSATGMTVKAAAGMSEAHVGNLKVGGEDFGSITATCKNGVVTKVSHSGKKPSKPNLKVYYGTEGESKTIGITVHIVGAGGKVAQEVTAAAIRCAKGSPPSDDPSQPPPSSPKPSQPGDGGSAPGEGSGANQDPAAPAPAPVEGHHPVTG